MVASFSQSHRNHPDFTVIFAKTTEQTKFEKDKRKAEETPGGRQVNHDAVEKQKNKQMHPHSIELGADNLYRNGVT